MARKSDQDEQLPAWGYVENGGLRWPATTSRIVYVDQAKLRDAGLLPPVDQRREMMDQYRAIKRPLLRAAFESQPADPSPKLIMVTSALPGDGKTLTCVNLARSMAMERDSMVLLVDGDVAKRSLSRVFGLERERGLIDALSDPEMPVESVIFETTIPKLAILPAGQPIEIATELLASARMHQLMQRLAALDDRGDRPHRFASCPGHHRSPCHDGARWSDRNDRQGRSDASKGCEGRDRCHRS